MNVGESDAQCGHTANLRARTSGLPEQVKNAFVRDSQMVTVSLGEELCAVGNKLCSIATPQGWGGGDCVADWFESV